MLHDLSYWGRATCTNTAELRRQQSHVLSSTLTPLPAELQCAGKLVRMSGCSYLFWPDALASLLPTSHIKVSGGRVAHAFHIRRHALVLPLVGLLAVLDLQGTWGKVNIKRGGGGKTDRERETARRTSLIDRSVTAHQDATGFRSFRRPSNWVFLSRGEIKEGK